MKKASLCIWVCLVFVHTLFSQYEAIGARSAGMADASVPVTDAWSCYNNPSALGFSEKMMAGFSYKNNFLIKELSQYSACFSVPVKKVGVFYLNADRFGYDLFNHNKFGFGYARKFGKIFSLGIQFNLHWLHIGDVYGDKITASGALSFTVKPLKHWTIAGNIYNISATLVSADQHDRIHTIFRLGTSYLVAEKLLISMEGEASLQLDPGFKAGLEYKPIHMLAIRAGFHTNPIGPAFGFGLEFKHLFFDFAGKWNPVLGFSPMTSLAYSFGK